ncbi:hypothetical protein ACN38_g4730 [Penicillium nordicum]|uniref:Glutaminase n=1 Tax=Penicillium nordicum TaxID=229535 RepID=A0A0M8P3I4_9EURO|nr:hypothetical protein ACN38_g4730 [Penicillium nordicum]
MWLLSLLLFSLAAGSYIPLSSYPLARKTWLPGDQAKNVSIAQPEFWAGQPLTWKVIARVNGEIYSLFGCPDENITSADQISISYTATHTVVALKTGSQGPQFTLDFFSPVSTVDFARQSIPFSYLTVLVYNNNIEDEVDVMTAIDESWSAQPGQMVMKWHEGRHSQSFIIKNYQQVDASEDDRDMATWGRVVFSSNMSQSLTYQSAAPSTILSQFSLLGQFSQNTSNYTRDHLVAFAYRFVGGNVVQTSLVTFALGLQQDLNGFFGEEYESLYFEPLWPTTEEVVDHFLEDEACAREESIKLDRRVREIGERFSSNYADILEGTVRQIWGSIHISVPWGSKDTLYHLGFMKAISAGGRVSPVSDLLPRALPAFYVLAPDYIPLLLKPVLNMTLSWPMDYAIHDIGKHYPNATGPTDDDEYSFPLQQTSALLWIVYAYQKVSGDIEWAKPFLPALHRYADYLVRHGQYPPEERSTIDHNETQANQTLIAISASIGLKAYGALSRMTNYTDIGNSYASTIMDLGTDTKQAHFTSHYGRADSTWITSYPLAYDKLLGLDTFDEAIYEMQSTWYKDLIQPDGLQFSSEVQFTVADLEMMAAATCSNDVQTLIVDGLHQTTTSRIDSVPGPNRWKVTGANSGRQSSTKAQAAVGGYWMMAAVNM